MTTSLPREKGYLGWLEGVVLREGDVQEEDATLVGGVGRAHDGGDPLEYVVALGACRAVARRVETYLCQLFLYSARKKRSVATVSPSARKKKSG
jgi:hypothetical protein